MIVGDAANFLLNGIPGDVHDMFVADVEPDDLVRASTTLRDMSTGVRALHVKLSGKVASFEGGWHGRGRDAFDSELWQPVSNGLGVLERECDYAADQFSSLAAQAAEAHVEKIAALNQEIQTQLWLIGATTLVGSPELGGMISKAVVGLATRLGGETVGSIVAAIVKAIEDVIAKVLAAFGRLIEWSMTPVKFAVQWLQREEGGIFIPRPRSVGVRQFETATSGLSGINNGASSIFAYPGGLAANDALGGHVLSHIGLSDTELAARGLPEASTFTDRATAEAAVCDTLAANDPAIQSWLSSAKPGERAPFAVTFDAPVGRVLYQGMGSSVAGNTALIILRACPGRPPGFYVLTAYVKP